MTGLVIGDDHSVFLDAMSAVLVQRGYQVTAARSVADTIETVRRTQPDVCLIDRHFAGDNGITAISQMLAVSSRTKVLVLSADPDTEGIRQALHAGASGYLHKTRGVSALTRAIDRVQRGEVVVNVPKPAPVRPPGRQDDARPARRVPHRPRAGMPASCWWKAWTRPGSSDQAGGVAGHGAHPRPVADDEARRAFPARGGVVRGSADRLLEDEVARFPVGAGTGLVRGKRRRTARTATARPAAPRAASRTQSGDLPGHAGRGRGEAVGVRGQRALGEQGQAETQAAGARRHGRRYPAGLGPARARWKYGLDVQYTQRPDQVRQ